MTDLSPVDLHCHSTASDGTFRPRDVVRIAYDAGLSGIALTDHDTVAGLAEAATEAERGGSDFHGSSKPGIRLGKPAGREVPRWFLDVVQQRLRARARRPVGATLVSPCLRMPGETSLAPAVSKGPVARGYRLPASLA